MDAAEYVYYRLYMQINDPDGAQRSCNALVFECFVHFSTMAHVFSPVFTPFTCSLKAKSLHVLVVLLFQEHVRLFIICYVSGTIHLVGHFL